MIIDRGELQRLRGSLLPSVSNICLRFMVLLATYQHYLWLVAIRIWFGYLFLLGMPNLPRPLVGGSGVRSAN